MTRPECLPHATLVALLDGAIADAARAGVESHIETCQACQTRLGHLSEAPDLPRRVAPDAADAWASSLARLEARQSVPDAVPPRFPGYDVIGLLGRGGMGVVWRAFDPALRREIAIKTLVGHDPRDRERFVREARAAARVRHPNVAQIHTVGDEPGRPPFLVMELVEGPSLREEAARTRGLEPRAAATICAAAADGLATAHAAGVIHRDLTPGNILLAPGGAAADNSPPPVPVPKLVDFGLARSAEDAAGLTQSGMVMGTPPYMSPEQVRDPNRADGRSDVYGLGASLYEALTGTEPFRGSVPLVLKQVLEDDPIPPRRLNPGIPRDLETICLTAMAKEPTRRYQTAAALRDELNRWLRGDPITARPLGPVGRARWWARRNPVIAGLTAALTAVVVVAFAVVTWLWREAAASAETARQERVQSDADYHRAEAVVDRFYSKLYEEGTLAAPVSLETRRELIREAIRFYEDVARRRPEKQSPADLASAYSRLGWLNNQLRDPDGALVAYRTAAEHFADAVRETPSDVARLRGQAECQFHLGLTAARLGDADAALGGYEAAARLFEPLAADEKGKYFLAGSLGNAGVVHEFLGEFDRARAAHERSGAIYRELRLANPKESNYLQDLFWETLALGILHPDPAGAMKWLTEADALAAEYAAAYRTDYNSVKVRCAAKTELARGLLRAGKPTEAAAAATEAVAATKTLAKFPAPFNSPGTQAAAWAAFGDVKQAAGDSAEAEKAWQTAAGLYEPLPRRSLAEKVYVRRLAVLCDRLATLAEKRGDATEAAKRRKQAASFRDQFRRE